MILIAILVLLASIPTGFLLAWIARDELIEGRRWFCALFIVAVCFAAAFFLLNSMAAMFSCIFIAMIAYISYRKSFDKSWTKK